MSKKLFLLDGMALVYRAHFALIARPIMTSKGVNTSALYGFTQTLLEILREQKPTHIAVAFDTEAPTQRHAAFPEYKATRQAMPEDLSQALPHVQSMLEAFRIPAITCDGYEADDIIGTLVTRAAREGFVSYMVTPDKDFGQLVGENIFLYRPGRMGDSVEILGVPEIQQRWGIENPEQVIDILALMGDSVDNIPGLPGVGEKTAIKLIRQFGSVENLVGRSAELTGKIKETVEKHRETALLSKQLATILCNTPCETDLDRLALREADEEKLKGLLVEFEFNSIGKRLFGDAFKAGRGYTTPPPAAAAADAPEMQAAGQPKAAPVKPISEVPHRYAVADTPAARARLREQLEKAKSFAFKFKVDPGSTVPRGFAFCWADHQAAYVPCAPNEAAAIIQEFRALLESPQVEKAGHDLKQEMRSLQDLGIHLPLGFDVMIAHSLIEPDMRHTLEYLSESMLGLGLSPLEAGAAQAEFDIVSNPEKDAQPMLERVDVIWQVHSKLKPLLKTNQQERVFYEVEAPLIPVLASMELEGIRVDARALAEFSSQLLRELEEHEKEICRLAGQTFNLNSPRQLGQVLFEAMKICEAPKKTRTGQYATDEQTLLALAGEHEIVQRLLEHRAASKLKSTYADALPEAIHPGTGRVHTTYFQVMTSTGRLNSQNPNLQNIPIRTDRGQEIRKAFVPRGPEFCLLSADYSQIELRIIAGLSQEPGLLEAFRTGEDVHTATAAKVYNVPGAEVTAEMRRKAKMVNYGIAYGISAFGLAQRLRIPRREASEIIDQYFRQFAGIRKYMDDTIAFARQHGYVETVTGRRRYLRDITSKNATIRGSAERNAINMPIQGTAADMIKLAMIRVHEEMEARQLKSRMLLQVHDELVFDAHRAELEVLKPIVEERMKNAIPLAVPIVVEMGTGENWLEAH